MRASAVVVVVIGLVSGCISPMDSRWATALEGLDFESVTYVSGVPFVAGPELGEFPSGALVTWTAKREVKSPFSKGLAPVVEEVIASSRSVHSTIHWLDGLPRIWNVSTDSEAKYWIAPSTNLDAPILQVLLPRILLDNRAANVLPPTLPLEEWAAQARAVGSHETLTLYWPSFENPAVVLIYELDDTAWPVSATASVSPCSKDCPRSPVFEFSWHRQRGGGGIPPRVEGADSRLGSFADSEIEHFPRLEPGGSAHTLEEAVELLFREHRDIEARIKADPYWAVTKASFSGSSSTGESYWIFVIQASRQRQAFMFTGPGQGDPFRPTKVTVVEETTPAPPIPLDAKLRDVDWPAFPWQEPCNLTSHATISSMEYRVDWSRPYQSATGVSLPSMAQLSVTRNVVGPLCEEATELVTFGVLDPRVEWYVLIVSPSQVPLAVERALLTPR